jgi:hypothetical protein
MTVAEKSNAWMITSRYADGGTIQARVSIAGNAGVAVFRKEAPNCIDPPTYSLRQAVRELETHGHKKAHDECDGVPQ